MRIYTLHRRECTCTLCRKSKQSKGKYSKAESVLRSLCNRSISAPVSNCDASSGSSVFENAHADEISQHCSLGLVQILRCEKQVVKSPALADVGSSGCRRKGYAKRKADQATWPDSNAPDNGTSVSYGHFLNGVLHTSDLPVEGFSPSLNEDQIEHQAIVEPAATEEEFVESTTISDHFGSPSYSIEREGLWRLPVSDDDFAHDQDSLQSPCFTGALKD